MIGELVRHILITNNGVKAITTTINPTSVSSKLACPKIGFELVTADPQITNDGPDRTNYAYQIVAYSSKTYTEAEDLAKAIVAALQLYSDASVKKVIVGDVMDAPAAATQVMFAKIVRATFTV